MVNLFLLKTETWNPRMKIQETKSKTHFLILFFLLHSSLLKFDKDRVYDSKEFL